LPVSSSAAFCERLQLKPFVGELLFLRVCERPQGSQVGETVGGARSPGTKDNKGETSPLFIDGHRDGRIATGKQPGRPVRGRTL
jgi:hypothetical protein